MEHTVLVDKFRKILNLYDGAATDGERDAAVAALRRIHQKMSSAMGEEKASPHKFSIENAWSRQLFAALAQKHGLQPYREPRQRRTTIMLDVKPSFLEAVLWPEFEELDAILLMHLTSEAAAIISEVIGGNAKFVD